MASLSADDARALLGVERDADVATIRSAYRRMARVHHPDAGGDAGRFQQLTAAVELLTHPRFRAAQPRRSPSTGRRAYPSTRGQYTGATGAVWHTGDVDTSMLDDTALPRAADPWSRDDLARAVAAGLARDAGDLRVRGVSRRPRSLLNRVTRHLSDDLLAHWEVVPASQRGMVGHDLEVVARFPSGARKHVDRASLPPGWSVVRRPSSTTATQVIHPHHDPGATAVVAADGVEAFLAAIAWPLGQWRVPAA